MNEGRAGSKTRELVREGAQEVKEKLREDLSRWGKVRRFVSLKPTIPCLECDGRGKLECGTCRGTGKMPFTPESGQPEDCPKCGGSGTITCVDCAGKGYVPNPHRTKLLVVLWAGGFAWLLILIQLWGRDILPEERARLLQRGEHGRSVTAPSMSPGQGGRLPSPAANGPLQGTVPQSGLSSSSVRTPPRAQFPAPGSVAQPPSGLHGNALGSRPGGFGGTGPLAQPSQYPPSATQGMPPAPPSASYPLGGGHSLPSGPRPWPR